MSGVRGSCALRRHLRRRLRAPAKVATTEKVPFGRCARLRAGAAIGRPPGARVITANQGPHRARSTRARGSDISNGVTQFSSSLYLSDCNTCHLSYVAIATHVTLSGSTTVTAHCLRAWKASAEALSDLRALDCGRGHRNRPRCEWKARRRACLSRRCLVLCPVVRNCVVGLRRFSWVLFGTFLGQDDCAHGHEIS